MSKFVLSGFADEASRNLNDQMDMLDPIGIRYIELRGTDHTYVGSLTREEATEMAARLRARGYKVSSIGGGVGKIKIDADMDEHLAYFKNNLMVAEIFGAPYIRMFSFYPPDGEKIVKYRDRIFSQWEKYLKLAEGTGVTPLHENEGGLYGDTAERCLDLAETLGAKLIFDPANFINNGVSVWPDAWQALKKHVVYMHVKDARRGFGVVPSGFGEANLPAVFLDMDRSGFEGFLSLEPHLENYGPFDDLELKDKRRKAEILIVPERGPQAWYIAAEALIETLRGVGIEPSYDF